MTDRLEEDLDTASRSDLPLEERIAAAARLWDFTKRVESAMDPLKEILRAKARESRKDRPCVVTLEGVGMTRATVTFPERHLKIQSGLEHGAIKQILGDRLFHELCEEKVTPRPDASARVHSMSTEDQGVAVRVFMEVEGKPRVSLQFGGDGIVDLGSR